MAVRKYNIWMKNKRANIRSFASNHSPYVKHERKIRNSGTFGRQNLSKSMLDLNIKKLKSAQR